MSSNDHTSSNSASNTPQILSFLDLGVLLAVNKTLVLRTTLLFAILGLLVILLSPTRYTSSVQVVPESDSGTSGPGAGALSALQGLGLSLGGVATGLSPEAYPEIIASHEVRLAVAQDTFYFSDIGQSMTYVSYVEVSQSALRRLVNTILGLPGRLLRSIKSSPSDSSGFSDGLVLLTREEVNALSALSDLVSTSQDLETGLLTITVTSPSRTLSATLVEAVIKQLRERVREIHTIKARENLAFIESQFEEAETDLQIAEESLALFDDRNNNLSSAQLRTERDRLQRQVSFAAQLFSNLQSQRTQAQIELQRSEPIVTVLESPIVPLDPSGPSAKTLLLLFILLGLGLGVLIAFLKQSLNNLSSTSSNAYKLNLIRSSLNLNRKPLPSSQAKPSNDRSFE